jgi:hypothetical protein
MTIFASLLIAGGLLFVARCMWRIGQDDGWSEQDDRDYAALCESERGA